MTMKREMRKAIRALAQLHSEAARAQAQLTGLQLEISEAELHLSGVQSKLLEANHKLMMAALRVDRAAGAAITDLSVLEHAGHQAKLATHASSAKPRVARSSYLGDLREANERLVVEAMLLQQLAAQLDEGQRKQIEFLAVITHELRNPLSPLRTAAALLTHPNLEREKLAQVQASIHRQVEHMARLIADLVDGSRAAIGKFHLHKTSMDLREAIDQAIENARPAMDRRRQQFELQIPESAALWVDGDATRLAQVFSNLLDNASKYSPESATIALSVALDDAQICVTVSDTGIGISSSALPNVFELFMQDVPATKWHRDGLGIGLAVVRELVVAHGGSVVARSAGSGLGSAFEVTLPLCLGEASTTTSTGAPLLSIGACDPESAAAPLAPDLA